MSGLYCLGWMTIDGVRHVNPRGRERELIEAHARLANGRGTGTIYEAIPAENLKTWKELPVDGLVFAEPERMLIDNQGDPIPERLIPGRTLLENQTVELLIEKAAAMQAQMSAFKLGAFQDVYAFLDALRTQYRSERAGRRNGVALTSFDGLKRLEISVADSLTFGPELTIAKELIDACIVDWSKDSNAELKVLVNDAFRVGSSGKIQIDRVIGLRRLDIKDHRWMAAMVAIGDALKVASSRSYIRFYRRANADAKWEQISLDMSGL